MPNMDTKRNQTLTQGIPEMYLEMNKLQNSSLSSSRYTPQLEPDHSQLSNGICGEPVGSNSDLWTPLLAAELARRKSK